MQTQYIGLQRTTVTAAPQSGSGRGSCRWTGSGVTPLAAESSLGRPAGAPQSLGPCYRQTTCATQTLPAMQGDT